MVRDFKECVKQLSGKASNDEKQSSTIQMYGACAQIPDDYTQNEIMM